MNLSIIKSASTLLLLTITFTFFSSFISAANPLTDSATISINNTKLAYFAERNARLAATKNISTLSTEFDLDADLSNLAYTGQVKSTPASATSFIASTHISQKDSAFSISYDRLTKDLITRVNNPKSLNQGQETNFCWAAAFSTFLLRKDPQGIAKAIIGLYQTGTFHYANVSITPAKEIIANIGTETFANNAELNDNVIDQMLLMTLASEYKGYINFDRNYNSGDEEKATYAGRPIGAYNKVFNDFGITHRRVGSDFGWTGDNAAELQSLNSDNTVFLYINSGFFFRGAKVPVTGSHYVILEDINITEGQVTFTYWDYGHENGRTVTMSQNKFNHGTFGAIIVPNDNYKNGLANNFAE